MTIDQNYLLSERLRVADILKQARIKKGLTQQDLSDQMKISRSTISKIEDGKWNFTIDMLNKFAAFLDVKILLLP